ncbi:MAG: hypothetical protein HOV94_23045 [Saccharothrix sp.]|nr:hypothetical protein [Saccharothrix sp.]
MTNDLVELGDHAREISQVLELLDHAVELLPHDPDDGRGLGPHVERVRATLVNLRRAHVLAVRATRKYDDRENFKKRAALLQAQFSAALNDRLDLRAADGDLHADALDRAKDLAGQLRLDSPARELLGAVEDAAAGFPAAGQRQVFLVNLCYELLVRVDEWVHFSELARGNDVIERSIEFPADYFNAGMMVLNEFATIIRERYGQSGASVKIHQEDLRVRLVIQTANAKEEIERTLDHYGDVISGSREVDTFTTSAIERVRLEGALELAQARLNAERRITNVLEAEVAARGDQLTQVTNLLAGALASGQSAADRQADVALAALRALSVERYARVLAEVARAAFDHADAAGRRELAGIAARADRSSEPSEVEQVDSRLRLLLKRLAAESPGFIRFTSSAITMGVLSNEAAAWMEALLKNLL